MNTLLDHIAEEITRQGLSIGLLSLAVWFLYGKIKECEADRKALWERVFSIQQQHNQNQ